MNSKFPSKDDHITEGLSAPSQTDLHFAVSAACIGIWFCEWPFNKIVWSDVCHGHFFLEPETDVDFDLFYSLLHPDDEKLTRRAIEESVADHTEYNVEYRAVAPDGRLRWINAIGRATYDESGTPLRFDGITIDVTERKEVEAQLAAAYHREALLNQIGQAVRHSASSVDVETTALRGLAEALGADRCVSIVIDLQHKALRFVAEWKRFDLPSIVGDYPLESFDIDLADIFPAGESLIVPDVQAHSWSQKTIDMLASINIRALLDVPSLDENGVIGVLGVFMAEQPRAWTHEEVTLVEAVASNLRSALEVNRAHDREHRIATELQVALQPVAPAEACGLTLSAAMKPALDEAQIGGDFYDVFNLDKDVCALVIGDVSGKGLSAAAQLATIRNMLRAMLYEHADVGEAITSLNSIVTVNELITGFVTLFVGIYDCREKTLSWVSCGHEPVIVQHSESEAVEELFNSGPPICVEDSAIYETRTLKCVTGDRIILYTDGLSEAGPSRRDLLGTEGLVNLLRELPMTWTPSQVNEAIMEKVTRVSNGVLLDDACLVVATVT